jgi:putative membrane protein
MTAARQDIPEYRIQPASNRLLFGVAGVYTVIWIIAAIAPLDRFDWLLENLLVFALVAVLAAIDRRYRVSAPSYVLLLLFLSLHAMGSHYTYSEAPVGYWMQDLFGFTRNHFDRVVHFSYGVLASMPIHDLIMRTTHTRPGAAYIFTFTAVMTFSAIYEIIEWVTAEIVSPEAAMAYLGTQGDVFDAQKDAALAGAGSVLGILIAMALTRYVRKTR